MFLKSLRICGDVLINFAVASLGTAILEAELEHVIDRQTLYSLKNYLLVTGAVAFGLGCTVYLKWRLRASLWLWLPGLAGLLWELAHRGKFPTFYDFAGWATWVFVSLRLVAYSAGALCCSGLVKKADGSTTKVPSPPTAHPHVDST